jgi:hypothetical protein
MLPEELSLRVAIDRNLTKNDSFGSSVLCLSTSG